MEGCNGNIVKLINWETPLEMLQKKLVFLPMASKAVYLFCLLLSWKAYLQDTWAFQIHQHSRRKQDDFTLQINAIEGKTVFSKQSVLHICNVNCIHVILKASGYTNKTFLFLHTFSFQEDCEVLSCWKCYWCG